MRRPAPVDVQAAASSLQLKWRVMSASGFAGWRRRALPPGTVRSRTEPTGKASPADLASAPRPPYCLAEEPLHLQAVKFSTIQSEVVQRWGTKMRLCHHSSRERP